MSNLIISSVSDDSLQASWLDGLEDTDLWVAYYGDSEEVYERYSRECNRVWWSKGGKWENVYKIIKEVGEDVISRYSYIWVPDDDMKIRGVDLNSMFDIAEKNNLILCQPSIWPARNYTWPGLLKWEGGDDLFTVNTVECQAPCINVKFFLEIYEELIPGNYTGWGLDVAWGWILTSREEYRSKPKPTVINTVHMEHTRKQGSSYNKVWEDKSKKEYEYNLKKYSIPVRGIFRVD